MTESLGVGIQLLYGTVGIVAFVTALFKPQWFPVVMVLLMPTGNFDAEWGITWSLYKLLLIVFLVTLPARLAIERSLLSRIRLPLWLWLFLIGTTLSTLLNWGYVEAGSTQDFDLLRGPQFRSFVQLVSLVLRAMALMAVLAWVTNVKYLVRVLKALLMASTAVATYGVYQFIGYYAGWPIMGITRAQADLTGRYATFLIANVDIFRIGSFVGEPKVAAKFLLPSILLIVFAKTFSIDQLRGKLTSYPILILHCLVFILTFSTSSFFGLSLSFPILVSLIASFHRRVQVGRLLVLFSVLSLVFMALVWHVGPDLAAEVFEARVTRRVGEIDNPERATLEFLKDNPAYLATGIGLGNGSFYLRPYFDPQYYRPLTVSLNSRYIEVLLEGGIVGIMTYLLFLGTWLLRALRLALTGKKDEFKALVAAIAGLCVAIGISNAFSSNDGTGQIWLFWGLLIAICRLDLAHVPKPVGLWQPTCSTANRGASLPPATAVYTARNQPM